MKSTRTTLAAQIRTQIADGIVRGAILPDAVRAQPHRGAVVAWPSAAQIEGMFAVMAELEALCAGTAAVQLRPSECRPLAAPHEQLRELVHQGDPQRYHDRPCPDRVESQEDDA